MSKILDTASIQLSPKSKQILCQHAIKEAHTPKILESLTLIQLNERVSRAKPESPKPGFLSPSDIGALILRNPKLSYGFVRIVRSFTSQIGGAVRHR